MTHALEENLRSDRYHFTMYPTYRGSNRDYLETFFDHIPDKFRSDDEFVMDFLYHDYFAEEFDMLYDWMDKKLWHDKDIVLKALEVTPSAVIYIPQELSTDEEIRTYIEENIDFEWDLNGIPDEKIPQWIKNWN